MSTAAGRGPGEQTEHFFFLHLQAVGDSLVLFPRVGLEGWDKDGWKVRDGWRGREE